MRGHDDIAIIDTDPCWRAQGSDCIRVQYYVVSGTDLVASGHVALAVRGRISSNSKGALRVRGCARWGLSWGSSGCCQVVFEASGVDEATEPQGIQVQKGRQLRAGEGGLRHVEVFQLPCMTVSIVGRPRPLPIATMHHPHPPPTMPSSTKNRIYLVKSDN